MLDLGGRYALDTECERTPLAQLYRGYRRADGAPVLAKLLRAERPSPLELARFRHDYAGLESLDVTGLARPCGLETFENGLAVVIGDPGEVSLERWIRSSSLDVPLRVGVALSLARLLGRLHERDVIHNDLRPSHFYLRPAQPAAVTLIDLGRAIRLAHGTRAPPASFDGDEGLRYAAPEQTGRMNRIVDKRSDLYSLGAVLYELFTGRPPFDAADPLELVHCHIARQPLPPMVIERTLPSALSDLILKLLAKTAEDRYQSATGVAGDLERIARALESGQQPAFALAADDASGELAIPQKLYGRQLALGELRAHAEACARGGKRLCLLAGASGIGKSALVSELGAGAVNSYFVRGKFDLLNRATPYSAIVEACRGVIDAALAEGQERLARQRAGLARMLGTNARVLLDLIPELELVVGPQPSVPPLGPMEAQRRFEDVFQAFVRAFATPERPLVMFFDDLQWADAASLRLVQLLMQSKSVSCLLLIGAYRESDVSAVHPLSLMLEELRRHTLAISTIELGPLGVAETTQLLADTLSSRTAEVEPLASALLDKTQGNPFFIWQFLRALEKSGALFFDRRACAWRWDLTRVKAELATDNVVDFMLERSRRLSPAGQEALRLAACIGHTFDARTLALIASSFGGATASGLWEALDAGLVLPLDGNYRYAGQAGGASKDGLNARYQFVHDRVRQAAHRLLAEDEQRRTHLALGRALLDAAGGAPRDEQLFEIVDHLDRERALIDDGGERRRLAKLNVRAATRARDAAAAAASSAYAGIALELLGSEAWALEPELVYRVHLLQAECAYLNGNLQAALEPLDAIEARAGELLERAAGRRLRSVILTNLGQLPDACEHGAATARLLGLELPPIDDKASLGAAIGKAFARFKQALGARGVASLAELPPMKDAIQLALADVLASTVPAAYQSNPELAVLAVLEGVRLSLEHGTAPISPFFYCQYAIVHIASTGDLATADRFGELGVSLAARSEHRAAAPAVHFLWAGFVAHWCRPFAVCHEHFRRALELSLELGDYAYASYCATHGLGCRFFSGQPLGEIASGIEDSWELIERTGDFVNHGFLTACARLVRAAQQHTRGSAALDLPRTPREFAGEFPPSVQAMDAAGQALLLVLAGDAAAALEVTERVAPLPGIFYAAAHRLYHGLALARLARLSTGREREERIAALRRDVESFEPWAAACAENHRPGALLLAAELAVLEGAALDALERYDGAIEAAREHGHTHLQALANELCAELYLARSRPKLARAYLTEAQYLYRRWGAGARAAQLGVLHRELLEAPGAGSAPAVMEPGIEPARAIAGRLDLATAVRVTQAISTELELNRVVERVMRTLAESAGARRAHLVLNHEGALQLEAELHIDPDAVRVGIGRPLEASDELALSVVHYVVRTHQPVVLGDAGNDPRFRHDPFIASRQPKSILCVPMLHQGKVSGVLYLENDSAIDAFNPERCELLQFLAAQSAVAVENARLYGALNAATQRLALANETLEQQVRERTEQLRRSVADLWSEMDLAKRIQTVLLPEQPEAPNYQIAARMRTAESVGGDYYDVVRAGGKTWVMIGDVSGHGVAAGLVMMMVHTALETVLTTSPDALSPASALARVNAAVRRSLQQIGGEQYMTLTILELGPGSVRHAGLHQDILIYRAGRAQVERVETRGAWLGVLDDIAGLVEDDRFELTPGDTLLLFTDGVTEQRVEGGELLGSDGLARRFAAAAAEHPAPLAILNGLFAGLSRDAPHDDMTLMVVRFDPAANSSAVH
jgi:predicted ATPase/serine phosphatase RsbU (regulator of sigma subunit)